jgi:hypothetical protein
MKVQAKSSSMINQSSINSHEQSDEFDDELPEKPVVVIEARRRNSIIASLHDLWQYRDLFYILTLRNIKVRYQQNRFRHFMGYNSTALFNDGLHAPLQHNSWYSLRRNSLPAICIRGFITVDFLL